MVRIGFQYSLIGLDRLHARIWIRLVLQGQREPIFGVALGHYAHFGAQFTGVKIEDELAGDGLEFPTRAVILNIALFRR